jgi:hypothetical protein
MAGTVVPIGKIKLQQVFLAKKKSRILWNSGRILPDFPTKQIDINI